MTINIDSVECALRLLTGMKENILFLEINEDGRGFVNVQIKDAEKILTALSKLMRENITLDDLLDRKR